MEFRATVGENGRIILPVKIRKQLNIVSGDQIMLVLDDEELKLVTLSNKVRHFQEMVKKRNKGNISLVESLKNSRKKDAERE